MIYYKITRILKKAKNPFELPFTKTFTTKKQLADFAYDVEIWQRPNTIVFYDGGGELFAVDDTNELLKSDYYHDVIAELVEPFNLKKEVLYKIELKVEEWKRKKVLCEYSGKKVYKQCMIVKDFSLYKVKKVEVTTPF